jgi:hypothetical protein
MNLDTIKAEARKAERSALSAALSGRATFDEFTKRLAQSDELAEQERILEAITPAAHEDYMKATLGAAERDRQAAEIGGDNDWLQKGGAYMEGTDLSLIARLHDAGFGEDGRF